MVRKLFGIGLALALLFSCCIAGVAEESTVSREELAAQVQSSRDTVARLSTLEQTRQNPVYTEFLNICDEILGGAIDDPSLSMNEKADIFNTIYLSTLYELKIGAGCLLILGERAAEKEMSSDIQAWDYDEQTIQAYKLEYDFIVNSPNQYDFNQMTDVQGQQFVADFEELLQYEIHANEWGRYGDMTGDNKVSLADVMLLARAVVSGGELADEIAFRKADLTADGVVSLSDVLWMARGVLGSVPLGQYVFERDHGELFPDIYEELPVA